MSVLWREQQLQMQLAMQICRTAASLQVGPTPSPIAVRFELVVFPRCALHNRGFMRPICACPLHLRQTVLSSACIVWLNMVQMLCNQCASVLGSSQAPVPHAGNDAATGGISRENRRSVKGEQEGYHMLRYMGFTDAAMT